MPSDSEIALFCYLHPGSVEKKKQVIHLLHTCYDYWDPEAQTTTWCYFTPSTRPNAPNQIVTSQMGGQTSTAIAGIEIYKRKSALSRQVNHPEFKRFHATATKEGLYARPEEMNAWYRSGGFLTRGDTSKTQGLVTTVLIKVKSPENDLEKVLKVLRSYANEVEVNEPRVLTYCIFTRKKAPGEILLFERYMDAEALKEHFMSKNLAKMLKKVGPLTTSLLNEWEEVEKSFVGHVPAGLEEVTSTKVRL